MATETDAFQPPYMSWATFDGIIETFRAVGVPQQIDRSVLRGKSGGDQSQFLKAAQGFGLITPEGVPTPRMHTYVQQPEQRPEILREILNERYADVVALGTDATPQQLHDQFRAFGIDGDTVRKAEAFYLNAARLAEIPLSPHFKATRPGAGGRKAAPRRTARRASTPPPGEPTTPLAPPDPTAGLHPAVATLVQSLPRFDGDPSSKPTFPSADRDAWFAYARATFNLIYALPDGDTGDTR